jgi:HJR/Mrr/RecB family endonuclease
MIYENRTNGEPDWLPSLEEVARARARLESLGIPQTLRSDPASPEIAPGETPWLWWAGAGLWLLIWPALSAGRVAGRWAILPVWLLVLLPVLHMLVLAVPVLLVYLAGRRGPLARRFARVNTLAQMLALEPDEFEVWTSLLFQLMGYRVRNVADTADHGIDLEVSNEQVPLGLVQCKRYRGTVGEPTVRDLYGTMAGAGAGRGWLVTTGAVSRQAREWAAGKPIELWDGRDLVALARKYA